MLPSNHVVDWLVFTAGVFLSSLRMGSIRTEIAYLELRDLGLWGKE